MLSSYLFSWLDRVNKEVGCRIKNYLVRVVV